MRTLQQSEEQPSDDALVDCPGCAKCERHGGLILKKGSGRPTSAWEPIWLFSKSSDYFWDDTAVKTATGAALRNFWLLGPEPSREQHYAAFPTAIPRIAISAGTSEKGCCPRCRAPWVRLVERTSQNPDGLPIRRQDVIKTEGDFRRAKGTPGEGWYHLGSVNSQTLGWAPSCACDAGPPTPCLVLDPFLGSGTTLLVASRLGRSGIGIELNSDYARMAKERIDSDCPMLAEPVEVRPPLPVASQPDLFSETEVAS